MDFYGYKLDFEPTRNVLAIQNVDKPGVIGRIGTVLGDYNINISAMQWGTRGPKAVSFVSVDCPVSQEVIAKLKEVDGVLKVSVIEL